jgi:hypothetical protein
MNRPVTVAVVGATGAVGETMLAILEQRDFPVGELIALASARSAGSTIKFKGKDIEVRDLAKFDPKGVEIGAGFASVAQKGSEHRDAMRPDGFGSNHAGGILGGISTGQPVVVSVAFKPTSSLRLPAESIDLEGNPVETIVTGRHDPCVGLRATPICEAMLALVLMDQALRHRAQCGDVGSVQPRIPT